MIRGRLCELGEELGGNEVDLSKIRWVGGGAAVGVALDPEVAEEVDVGGGGFGEGVSVGRGD